MPGPPNPERAATLATPSAATTSDWRGGLPALGGAKCVLRELRAEDAPSLLAMLTTEEVARFISPPPTTVEGFERFIAWARREREKGNYICYGVVPEGMTTAIGVFQLRSLESGFGSCEWGFALGSQYWGTGLFVEAAQAIVSFGVDVVGTLRFEARAAIANGRGNAALRKIGAVQEVRAAPLVPPRRSVSRPGAVVDPCRGLASPANRPTGRCPSLTFARPAYNDPGADRPGPVVVLTSDFNFELPDELIAQQPPADRGGSRLMVVDRSTGAITHRSFAELPSLLMPGDVLVVNDTRVFPARLIGTRLPGGGAAECFLIRPAAEADTWIALVHPGQRLREGSRMVFDRAGHAPPRGDPRAPFSRATDGAPLDRGRVARARDHRRHRPCAVAAVYQASRRRAGSRSLSNHLRARARLDCGADGRPAFHAGDPRATGGPGRRAGPASRSTSVTERSSRSGSRTSTSTRWNPNTTR